MRPLLRITSSPCFASLSLRTASTSMCSPVKAGVSCVLISSAGAKRAPGCAPRQARCAPASDCCPSSRCVCPLSCWMSLPGRTPESTICTQRPMPNLPSASFSATTSSFVQPARGRAPAGARLSVGPGETFAALAAARFGQRTRRRREVPQRRRVTQLGPDVHAGPRGLAAAAEAVCSLSKAKLFQNSPATGWEGGLVQNVSESVRQKKQIESAIRYGGGTAAVTDTGRRARPISGIPYITSDIPYMGCHKLAGP